MIEQLLKEIKEDKKDNLTTTSFQFKRDLWNFFQEGFKNKTAVEFGTHKGQTTKVLSHLFKKVYTINNQDNKKAKELNSDIKNITYIDNFDLYTPNRLPISENVNVFLVDAGHLYNQVANDIQRIKSMNCSSECYIIFDDYGMGAQKNDVKKAVDEAIEKKFITLVKKIGHGKDYDFGNNRILSDNEGIITKLNNDMKDTPWNLQNIIETQGLWNPNNSEIIVETTGLFQG